MDLDQFEKLRPCGRLETYSTARHHLGFYNNVGLTATYTTSSDSIRPIQDLVFAALHHVVAEHPNLSAIPVNEDKSYPDVYFARLPNFELRRCVEFYTRSCSIPEDDGVDTEVDRVLRQQHSLNFKSHIPGPYWRLIVTTFPDDRHTFTASWIFHHALADGASAMVFHETFLEGLNKDMRHPIREVERLVHPPSLPLTQALEDLHPMTTSWPSFLSAVAASLVPGYFKRTPWSGAPIAQSSPQSMTKTIILSTENTRKFATWCHEQQTSVTAALSTLLALAIFQVTPPSADEITIDMPISLRPFLALAGNQMANAITNHTASFRRSDVLNENQDEDISQIARRVKAGLAREVKKKGADNPIALLKYVSNMHTFFIEKLGTERETTAEVSNLGVYRPRVRGLGENIVAPEQERQVDDGTQSWKIGRMLFSQSYNHTGPMISLSAATGGDGCLVMSFSWPVDLETTGLDEEELAGKRYYPKLVPGLMEQFVLSLIREGDTEGPTGAAKIPDKQAIAALVAGKVIDEEAMEQEVMNRAPSKARSP
ncbi:hypothetical protein E8E11_001919 [Didymella keratinophila]|nr:hypothetical protein E8E11_001919 [Didymella keratinophila]